MILAPATMAAESDPKMAASKCLEEVKLDPESYRIGHTKACLVHVPRIFSLSCSLSPADELIQNFNFFQISVTQSNYILHLKQFY